MTLLALLFACRSYDGPTFHADVAPVLDAYCMRCHTEGGIAPMKFDTYDEVKQWGPAIAEATANRTMPPKQVVADGSCGDWRDPWWMGDDEIALLSEWVVNEMPEGDAAPRGEPAALPTLDATHTVQTPVFEPVPVGGQYSEYDEYRCFAMPIEALAEDRFLAGYDVKPKHSTIVHHVIGHIVDPAADSWYSGRTNAEQMAYLDALDPDRAGWPCFSGAGDDVAYESDPMAWAPGQGATEFPNGLGVRVPAGSMIVTQVHYNLVDPATAGSTDTTQLEMKLVPEDEITKQMFVVYLDFLLGYGDSLPAGRDTVRRDRISLSQLGLPLTVDLVGLLPHMHARGLRLNATLKREDGSEECVVEVPAWDYGWQFAYFYETPIRIDPDDLYELTCWFDTSDATEPIYGGWGTQNEMCLTVMYVTI